MPLWESNEIYFLAGFSVLVTFGVFASLAYFLYKKVATNERRADEEQAALEKVLLRKETITSSPPTKPLIVSPSFSSPNKVPARHLRSGSYSPTHYLSPYHIRQPRRNSSPTSNVAPVQQPKLPQFQLHHPQLNLEQLEEIPNSDGSCESTSTGNAIVPQDGSKDVSVPLIKTNNNEQQQQQSHGSRNNVPGSLAHHNSQYYGTISPRRVGRHGVVAPAESNLTMSSPSPGGFIPLKCAAGGASVVPNVKHNSFMKSDYVQLPGKDGVYLDKDEWKNREEAVGTLNKWKNCSDIEDGALRRKLLLQKQYQQKLQLHQHNHQHRMSNEPPGELFKTKHAVSEEIPYYISTQ